MGHFVPRPRRKPYPCSDSPTAPPGSPTAPRLCEPHSPTRQPHSPTGRQQQTDRFPHVRTSSQIGQARAFLPLATRSQVYGVLVLLCFALLGLESFIRGDARYARVGSGAARGATRWSLGRFAG